MVIKLNKFFILIILTAMLLCPNICSAYSSRSIQWELLNLTALQKNKIKTLDLNWQKTSTNLNIQIINDKNKLRYLITNPYASDNEIRGLQNKLLANQKMLRCEAMNNFLQKRNVLSVSQRKRLHILFSN